MDKATNKLKMNITGSFHGLWSALFMRTKVRKLGLHIDNIKHQNIHHTEVVLSGDKDSLWKALSTVRTPDYLKMDRIVFEFIS